MTANSLIRLIQNRQPILMEGSLIERLSREFGVPLDSHILNAALLLDPVNRAHMASLHKAYIDVGRKYDLPLLLLTPTWRVNSERVRLAGIAPEINVNHLAVEYLHELRDEAGEYGSYISVGGLMGPQGDAYDPVARITPEEARSFHLAQAEGLADAGVDFLIASTLPTFDEALGISHAMASTALPYFVSYVIHAEGTLLDGTALHEAIEQIDRECDPAPLLHLVNCVHPAVLQRALSHEASLGHILIERLGGLQANTSTLRPEELDNLDHLESEEPHIFGGAVLELVTAFPMCILGGCCGTDEHHVEEIARVLRWQAAQ